MYKRQGWVLRSDAEHDKRQSLVRLTPVGRQKVRGLLRQAQQHEARVMADFGPGEAAQLKATLQRLIAQHH